MPQSSAWQLNEHNLVPELTPAEEIVLLARALYRRGYDDHLAGHITVRSEDDTLLCNPWFLLWDEFAAEDVIRIDLKGNLVEGRWPPPPGIPLHLALHQARSDVNVAVHNHARWSTTWADRGRAPTISTSREPSPRLRWPWLPNTREVSTRSDGRHRPLTAWALPVLACWPAMGCSCSATLFPRSFGCVPPLSGAAVVR